MRTPNERDQGQFGRHILDQLSEHLSKLTKGRGENDIDPGGKSGGFVGNFSDRFVNNSAGDGFNRSRKFSSKELQLLLLALLASKPAHGYELIKALETRSNGFYSPSPGMIYPALTHLDELEHITVAQHGNRKCYALSEAGRQFLAAHQDRVDLMWIKLTHIARKMDSVRRAYSNECPDEFGVDFGTDNSETWLPELIEARNMLKYALIQCKAAPATEQRRIAGVLIQAAGEILG